jgi:hypothetical protein
MMSNPFEGKSPDEIRAYIAEAEAALEKTKAAEINEKRREIATLCSDLHALGGLPQPLVDVFTAKNNVFNPARVLRAVKG